MTDREKAIVTAYTGACMLSGDGFRIFHEYIENIMGRPVYMHELAYKPVEDEIKEKAKADFIALCAEHEPCEDCISRQVVLKQLKSCLTGGETEYNYVKLHIDSIPPVTPQPKTGRWIEKYGEDSCGERYSCWVCSECGRDVGFNLANIEDVLSEYPYCHCGAKMVEPQESEE